ncbi:tripartite tricarboxylate transporter substrate binding protein [Mesobacillus maritimus]|uniref:tripartite tricarboxylate transporter substrate binding protein n=1 Tax=Mesobacillus maritimus TaxID=1643336 RepID=UPI00203F0274|nr:tripartite tricarboxylate transporter substrate binding protein [Mesobacillus maritimus]MCM3585962.1 tripartite tricarboxylate transporter substrate binding protein [Mesobacillus maritimus]MCM3670377.1 tripartite tricarboxylate transporter substrate binding protein [Mesobacillus maritimus]
MKIKKGLFLTVLLAIVLVLQACNSSSDEAGTSESKGNATNYPERQIEVVVGFGAGGGSDNFARAVTKELQDILGVNINVVNMEGAAGIPSADYVARKPADGYTIWSMTSNHPVNIASGAEPNDMSVFKSIGRVQHDTMTLQVKADGKFKDIDDLIAQAKSNPGKISVGGTGAKGFDELVLAQFEEATGTDFNYVSFDGSGEMTAALLGGHIDVIAEEPGPSIAQLEEGSIKMLIAFTDTKMEGFEDVPISTDLGIDVLDGQNRGFMVHKDTPDEIVEVLEKALEEAKDRPDYKEYEKASFLHLRNGWLGSEDYDAELEKQIETYKKILEEN